MSETHVKLTLDAFHQSTNSNDELQEFYTRLHEKASSTTAVLISVTSLSHILKRLEELNKTDPDKRLSLHAVPFVAKDNIDALPHATTAACPAYSHIPEQSAFVISELESHGAICIGKANMDQFACGLVGTRSPYGIAGNVHNKDFIPGGSSSGSAVAVAMGLCVFALGTDTAGSGRVPAAMNGLVGVKPTKGLLSTTGVVPAAESLDCVSILANNVADSAFVFALMGAYDAMNPYTRIVPVEKRAVQDVTAELDAFSFGVPRKEQLLFYGDSVAELSFRKSIEVMERMGGRLVEIDYEPFSQAAKLLYNSSLVSERFAAMGEFLVENMEKSPQAFDAQVLQIILGGDDKPGDDVFRAQKRVLEVCKVVKRDTWCKVDLLLLPSVPFAAKVEEVRKDPIGLNSKLGMYTNFVNLMDYCAVCVPTPQVEDPDHVPRGVTFIGQAFEENLLLKIAKKFEELVAAL